MEFKLVPTMDPQISQKWFANDPTGDKSNTIVYAGAPFSPLRVSPSVTSLLVLSADYPPTSVGGSPSADDDIFWPHPSGQD